MKFELINPSDPYTFEAESFEAAAMAVLLLGGGSYGACQIDGDHKVPIFILGGADAADSWLQDTFGASLEECFARTGLDIATVLESFTIRGERTSMNDIGERAAAIAAAIREKLALQEHGT